MTANPPAQRDVHAASAEAPGAPALSLSAEALAPTHLLDGGEIIILALKPSLWHIPLVSLNWLGVAVLFIAAANWDGLASYRGVLVQLGLLVGLGRLAYATLQWASRSYYLTNRRVMRIRGVLTIDVFECPLTKIQTTRLAISPAERLVRVGTIQMSTAGVGGGHAFWKTVARPLEVHEQLRAAIHKAQNRGTNGV